MASLIENLITVLDNENSEYQILVELSQKKTDALVQGTLDQLTNITDEEQIVVSRIHHLEKQREDTINDIANVINMDVKTLKLVDIIQALEKRPQEQNKLAQVHDRLQQTVEQMVNVNEQNKMLISNALEMVEFDLNLMQAMKAAPQTANYNKGAYSVGDTVCSDMTGFDAKQ